MKRPIGSSPWRNALIDFSPREEDEELEEAIDEIEHATRARGRGSIATVRIPREVKRPLPRRSRRNAT